MLIKADMYAANGITSLEADTTQELGSITAHSGSFTATEDCILIGTLKSNLNSSAMLFINGNRWLTSDDATYTTGIGYNNYGVFVPKGSVITSRATYGLYNVKFYKMK